MDDASLSLSSSSPVAPPLLPPAAGAVNDPYQPLFDLAGVGLAQLDPVTFRFLRVNHKLCHLTGYSQAELLSLSPIDITHPDDWYHDRPAFERLIHGDLSEHTVEKRYLRKDGAPTWVRVTLNPIRDPADGRLTHLVSVVRDIDRRVRIESDLKKRNSALAFLSDAATRLLMTTQPANEIPGIVERLSALLDLEFYETHTLDPADNRLHLVACCDSFKAFLKDIESIGLGQYTSGTVAQTHRPMVLEHAQQTTEPSAAMVRSLGITAWVCYPLLATGRLVGTMAMGTRNRHTFDPSDLEVVRTTCDQCASALERRRLTEQLEHRASDLTDANAAKDQFLAVLSHELRTPLTPVLLAASSLESDSTLPRVARDELAGIRQNIELEARLIDDLLDLTRISHGKLQLDLSTVDAHAVIRRGLHTVSADAAGKSLVVASDLNAAHHHVHADPARLQQILWNLLKNAIKFTPEGGTITIRTDNVASPRGKEPGPAGPGGRMAVERQPALRVQVIDTGIGIPDELLPKVFDVFEQGSPSITRRFGGLGLGLAISRALAVAHDGTLIVSSPGKDRGSTFTLMLPTVPAAVPSIAPPGPRAVPVRPPHLRILLVEDHASTASTLARLLRKLGHEVSVAAGVRRALELASQARFDLLISDIGLPDGSGLELIRELRLGHPGLPAIALSGYGTDADIQRSLDAGFSQHLTKPINIEQLKALTGAATR